MPSAMAFNVSIDRAHAAPATRGLSSWTLDVSTFPALSVPLSPPTSSPSGASFHASTATEPQSLPFAFAEKYRDAASSAAAARAVGCAFGGPVAALTLSATLVTTQRSSEGDFVVMDVSGLASPSAGGGDCAARRRRRDPRLRRRSGPRMATRSAPSDARNAEDGAEHRAPALAIRVSSFRSRPHSVGKLS